MSIKFTQLFNSLILVINIIILIALLLWSILGLWDLTPIEGIDGDILYWKVIVTLVMILIFNLTLVYCVVKIYRKNATLADLFAESKYSREYNEGDIIFEEGDTDMIMYLVIKGKVELYSQNEVFEQIESGGFFGEMAIIDQLPRTATARCIKPSSLIAINEKRFYDLFRELPFFAKEIIRAMSQRLRRQDSL